MSQENVEIVRRAFEAYVRGDLDAAYSYLDPESVSIDAGPDIKARVGSS